MSTKLDRAMVTMRSSELAGALDERHLSELVSQAEHIELSRGDQLFRQGDPGDCVCFVVSGRLRFDIEQSEPARTLVGEIGAGETVGEMALLTGEPRNATVSAVRDTRLLRISKHQFEALVQDCPGAVLEMARIILRRQHRIRLAALPMPPAVIAVLPTHAQIPVVWLTNALANKLASLGGVNTLTAKHYVSTLGVREDGQPASAEVRANTLKWLEEQEDTHDFLLLVAETEDHPWNAHCLQQADMILFLETETASQGDHLQTLPILENIGDGHSSPRRELIRIHSSDVQHASGVAASLEHWKIERNHQIRQGNDHDVARLARVITDRGIAVVLSGGGARGLAHVGVLKGLTEAGLPIDLIGGCSMGSLISATFAAGWNWDAILDINRRLWMKSRRLFDYTFPLVSLIAGRKAEAEMSRLFGSLMIEDLWINYFCVTSNLTTGKLAVHRQGELWKAVIASASLPGVAPPRIFDGELHCDGGVLDNLPVEYMRSQTRGPILAVDVGVCKEMAVNSEMASLPSGTALLWQKLNPVAKKTFVPGIASILQRTSTLNSVRRIQDVRQISDLYLHPGVEPYGLFDFKSFDAIVECGYRVIQDHLGEWRELIATKCSPLF